MNASMTTTFNGFIRVMIIHCNDVCQIDREAAESHVAALGMGDIAEVLEVCLLGWAA
jgi:hypothetical protein